MAIDVSTVKLLLWAKNLGAKFDRTATLGRLGLNCSPGELKTVFEDFGGMLSGDQLAQCFIREPCRDVFAEGLFRTLGAGECVSVDRSGFEGATFLHDLNEPFPETMRGQFDFVMDGGTLEHIFNYPAALKHSLELLRTGGHFLTVTPANGQMGHGFYQFSPELFFSVFTAKNGFALKKILIYESSRPNPPFYEVQPPAQLGGRVELAASPPVFLAVLAQKTAIVPIFAEPPQQSDYVAAWNSAPQSLAPTGGINSLRRKLNPCWPHWLRRLKKKWGLKISRPPNPASLDNTRSFRPLSRGEMTAKHSENRGG